MPVSVTATEVARDFSGVMKKVNAYGGVTVIKNSRPIARITPLPEPSSEISERTSALDAAKEFIDEYEDVFVELSK